MVRFFEIEVQQIGEAERPNFELTMICMKDITSIITQQALSSKKTYQEAIKNNFTHEQMTPLNLILKNTALVRNNILTTLADALNLNNEDQEQLKQKIIEKLPSSQSIFDTLRMSHQQAKFMQFHNNSQISRMLALTKELVLDPTTNQNFSKVVQKILYPFEL